MCSLEGKDQRQFGALHQKRERHQSDLHRAANAGTTILHLLVSLSVFPLTTGRLNLFRLYYGARLQFREIQIYRAAASVRQNLLYRKISMRTPIKRIFDKVNLRTEELLLQVIRSLEFINPPHVSDARRCALIREFFHFYVRERIINALTRCNTFTVYPIA